MEDYHRIINSLRINLNKELPGFAAQNRMAPSLRGGFPFRSNPDMNTKHSAVLICIYPYQSQPTIILIKRSTYNGAHSGQISFPGGKQEDTDETIVHTALREAQEEVGVVPSDIEILGELSPLYIPVSNLLVIPVVGILAAPPCLHLNLQEVEYTISVSLQHLKNPQNQSVKTIGVQGMPISAPYYAVGKEVVWGATAMIISELTELY